MEATYPPLIDSRHGYDIDTCQIFIGASSNLKREIGYMLMLKMKTLYGSDIFGNVPVENSSSG